MDRITPRRTRNTTCPLPIKIFWKIAAPLTRRPGGRQAESGAYSPICICAAVRAYKRVDPGSA